MIRLQAPAKSPVALTLLPDPELNDSEGLDVRINYRQTMTGVQYTYKSDNSRRKFIMSFENLARDKINELIEFVRTYHANLIRITTHNNEVWDVHLTIDPFEFEMRARAQLLGGERGHITLEMIGEKIN